MRILWITPWFGNYRIPVYDYLNQADRAIDEFIHHTESF